LFAISLIPSKRLKHYPVLWFGPMRRCAATDWSNWRFFHKWICYPDNGVTSSNI